MSNRDSTPSDLTAGHIILAVVLLACLAVVLMSICINVLNTGFDRGVRAAAKGEAVVVPLPDGTDVVVKVKKEP